MLGRAHVDVMILCCSDSMFGTVQLDAGLQKRCMMAFSMDHKHHTSEECLGAWVLSILSSEWYSSVAPLYNYWYAGGFDWMVCEMNSQMQCSFFVFRTMSRVWLLSVKTSQAN